MLKNIIVGSGIGGSLTASLQNKDGTLLFEQDTNLGGCASTFKRFGQYFNTGATTFVGYEEGHIVKKLFDRSNIQPNIQKSDRAIRIIQGNKQIDRIKNFNNFLEQINTYYPHKNNQKFWLKLKEIDEKFWQLKHVYYGKYSFSRYLKTSRFILELFYIFHLDILKGAEHFINEYLPNIDNEYQDFIDSQLLITVQSTSQNISLISLALGLCYPFHDVFYANGGMSELIKEITHEVNLRTNEKVQHIIPRKNYYEVISDKNKYTTKNVILNSSIYESAELFSDKTIQEYYKNFSFSDQSAFVVYLFIKNPNNFLHHYQIILNTFIPNSISKSFFISFSDQNDSKFNKNGTYSITISTHTKANFWKNLSSDHYILEKERTQSFIIKRFLEYFDTIKEKDIVKFFSATSLTFHRHIGRYNCGGKAIGFKNILELPSCQTPFKGLYHIGDTIFAGQGWPGVALGVDILNKELNG